MENHVGQNIYMDQALELANLALQSDEVPVGAIVVDENGLVIGRGYNQIEKLKTQMAHAEMEAIGEATKIKGDWRLDGCAIYVTLEPCLMCFGLISLSRIKKIVFGAKSFLFGVDLDNEAIFPLYKKGLVVEGGVREQESVKLLQDFFKKRRRINKKD